MEPGGSSPPAMPRLFGPGFYENPYPTYHALRATTPVFWDADIDAWVFTRYTDVAAALADPRLLRGSTPEQEFAFSAELSARGEEELAPLHQLLAQMMLFSDPPKHTRLRALAHKAFMPRVVEALRPHIQSVVDDALDAVQPNGRMDVIGDLAGPLPEIIIGELLGLPPEDRARFTRWSSDIIAFAARTDDTEEPVRLALTSMHEALDYFRARAAQLRDHPRDDLFSALVAAEEQGDRLSTEELLANAILLLMNGHETTTNMIGNGLLALLHHPDQMQRLRDDPALIVDAVEEMLRYDASVQLRGLGVARDFVLGGQQLRAGQAVMLALGGANRDPAQFVYPDRFDISRPERRHLALGHGIHFCIGAALARAEIQIAIGTVLRRMPTLQLTTEALKWRTSSIFRGVTALPVAFTEATL
jgi:pimeloyl-[acyl-carrier protein] synthase